MRSRVFFASKTRNTRRIAEAIAAALGCRAEEVGKEEGQVTADLLFLGAAVYATHNHGIPPEMVDFIARLEPSRLGRVALFCTGFQPAALAHMRSRLRQRGLQAEEGGFFCKGSFLLFNLGHPSEEDLGRAAAYARRIALGCQS
jgi:flavodoxin